ncbi:MAG: hypothetical protein HY976_01015 [Candidatus Kerfeldbacteria bacterium]|nr:hypothetical protein [Candidatus Kerfeldbacteria bacterium]
MFLTTHAAVGMLISQHTGSPLGTLGWSFASHFVLDFIPHGDEELYHDEEWKIGHRYRRVAIINGIDVACLLILTLWVVNNANVPAMNLMVVGILGSILPDFLEYLFPIIHQRFSWLRLIRWVYAITKPTGLRYLVRAQNWIHHLLHHKIIRSDVPFAVGLIVQIVIIGVVLGFALRPA